MYASCLQRYKLYSTPPNKQINTIRLRASATVPLAHGTEGNRLIKGSGSTSNLPHNSGRYIDTRDLATAENVYWAAYSYNSNKSEANGHLADYKLEYYKEIVVNGRTYWCFDCAGKGDYSNLICLVVDADPMPIEKRYMVEDLGAKDDFDFNDIVFDRRPQAGWPTPHFPSIFLRFSR